MSPEQNVNKSHWFCPLKKAVLGESVQGEASF